MYPWHDSPKWRKLIGTWRMIHSIRPIITIKLMRNKRMLQSRKCWFVLRLICRKMSIKQMNLDFGWKIWNKWKKSCRVRWVFYKTRRYKILIRSVRSYFRMQLKKRRLKRFGSQRKLSSKYVNVIKVNWNSTLKLNFVAWSWRPKLSAGWPRPFLFAFISTLGHFCPSSRFWNYDLTFQKQLTSKTFSNHTHRSMAASISDNNWKFKE